MTNHIVYKITHKPSKRYYIGKTTMKKWNNGYMGSGIVWKKIIKKYPLSEFFREIISIHENSNEAYEMESLIVDEELLQDSLCMNMIVGGKFDYYKNNIMKNIIVRNNKRDKTAKKYGFQNDLEFCQCIDNLFNNGNSPSKIAKIIGCDKTTIFSRLKNENYVKPSELIAKKCGFKNNDEFTDFIISEYEKGLTCVSISKNLGCKLDVILWRLQKNNIKIKWRNQYV